MINTILNTNPGSMLIIGLAALFVLVLLFWPKKGLFAILSKARANNQRVLLEDALKYLFDCEYTKNTCSVNSIAGNLNISDDKAAQLIERLNELGLITIDNQNLILTETGRSYSLRVVRVHRIWERYLADETSISPANWHSEADEMEHYVSQEETEKIAAQMGNPVFDPHGDPIPTPEGEIPEFKGTPLSQLKKGDTAQIIHIEDEPRSIYEQLIIQGLYLGMQIYVSNIDNSKVVFVANGDEITLTPLFAGQITTEKNTKRIPTTTKHELLSALEIGEQAEILSISPNCRGQQRRRLMDLGVVPNSRISAVINSASGDPIGYRVMGTTIGIRKEQADLIFIRKENSPSN